MAAVRRIARMTLDSTAEARVVVVRDPALRGYPPQPPYAPSIRYPEFPGGDFSAAPNPVYDLVRRCLEDLGLDAARRARPEPDPR